MQAERPHSAESIGADPAEETSMPRPAWWLVITPDDMNALQALLLQLDGQEPTSSWLVNFSRTLREWAAGRGQAFSVEDDTLPLMYLAAEYAGSSDLRFGVPSQQWRRHRRGSEGQTYLLAKRAGLYMRVDTSPSRATFRWRIYPPGRRTDLLAEGFTLTEAVACVNARAAADALATLQNFGEYQGASQAIVPRLFNLAFRIAAHATEGRVGTPVNPQRS